jgi:hypothetical protein
MAGLWSWRLIAAIRPMARHAVLAAMLVTMPRCSQIVLPSDNQSPGLQPPYVSLAAKYMQATLKNPSLYDGYEISGLRWVDTVKGWSWLACVRFDDHGHKRTYAIFIQNNTISDARYAVETDSCEAQSYTQFDLISGVLGRPTAPVQQPLY